MYGVRVSSFCSVILLFLASVAFAGQATSSISGTVVDTAGGLVPGAMVTVTSANGTKSETTTNSAEATTTIPPPPPCEPFVYDMAWPLAGYTAPGPLG